MKSYAAFSNWYDRIMGDRQDIADHLRFLISRRHPAAKTLLDVGCGTGSVTRLLQKHYLVTGLDQSAEMLAIAARRMPKARLIRADMTRFNLGEQFDAIVCVFDTVNHLCAFKQWERFFERAAAHLSPKGIFIFDINTERKLEHYSSESPYAEVTKEGTCVFNVEKQGKNRYVLDIRIFGKEKGDNYKLYSVQIPEGAFPTTRITSALNRYFRHITKWDPERTRPGGNSEELYFVCSRPKQILRR